MIFEKLPEIQQKLVQCSTITDLRTECIVLIESLPSIAKVQLCLRTISEEQGFPSIEDCQHCSVDEANCALNDGHGNGSSIRHSARTTYQLLAEPKFYGVLLVDSHQKVIDPESDILIRSIIPLLIQKIKFLSLGDGNEDELESLSSEIHRLRGLDKINQAIQLTTDLDQLLQEVLEVILELFNGDRAFLQYPCNPEASHWSIPSEAVRKGFPGSHEQGLIHPMSEDVRTTLHLLRENKGPLTFGSHGNNTLPKDVAIEYGFYSYIGIALYPKVGEPWQLGIHQCTYDRIWTQEELRLFEDIAARITDSLSQVLMFHDINSKEQENMAILRALPDFLFRISSEGIIGDYHQPPGQELYAQPADFLGKRLVQVLPPEIADQAMLNIANVLKNKDTSEFDYKLVINDSTEYFEARVIFLNTEEVLIVVRNTTREKIRQTQMAMFRYALDMSKVAVFLNDGRGKIIYVNQAASNELGYSNEELTRMYVMDILEGYPETSWESHVAELHLNGNMSFETLHRRKDQSLFPVEVHVSLFPYYDEMYHLALCTNITGKRKTQQHIRNVQNELSSLLTNLPLGIVRFDINGKIIYANAMVEKAIWGSLDNFYGKNVDSIPSLLDSIEGEHPTRIIKSVCKQKEPFTMEATWNTAFGVLVTQERFIPEFDDKNEVVSVLVIIEDITDRKNYEKELLAMNRTLRLSEERFHKFFSQSPVPVAVLKAKDLTIVNVNQAFLEKMEYVGVPVIGSTFQDLGLHENLGQRKLLLEMLEQNQSIEGFEFHYRTRTGRTGIALNNTISILIEEEPHLITLFQDITDLKAKEQELRKLSQAVEQSPASIVITDINGKIEYVNQKFSEITGYSAPEVLGQNPRILKTDYLPESSYQNLWETISKGEEWHGEFHNRRKDGSLFWEAASISPIIDKEGNITHYLAVKEDITERKEAFEELLKAKIKAEESDRLKTAFLWNVSHEIRTPMNAILGFTNLLFDPVVPNQEKEQYSQIVTKGAEDLLKIVDDILDISRIEVGQMRLNQKQIRLTDLMLTTQLKWQRVIDQRLLKENISLQLKMGAGLKSLMIKVDEKRLQQILDILMDNAIKFTSKGMVKIQCNKVRGNLHFSVEDTGIGIESVYLTMIFERFRQVEDSLTTRQYGGMGLGLSIARGLVVLMNGEIWVESEPGIGSVFHFTIPIEN